MSSTTSSRPKVSREREKEAQYYAIGPLLEQLENMGKGKEALRLKRKNRGSCGGWS